MDIRHLDFALKNETDLIINAALEIHNHLGSGFLEIAYKDAFCIELESRELRVTCKTVASFL